MAESLLRGALHQEKTGMPMNTIKNRAKEHLPMVLLTLLSIVQALALELLWSRVRESGFLFEATLDALLTWIQIGTSFLGIVVIWIVYASTAMRFRWVPTTSDSIYPFLIGILEFTMIETLAPRFMGWWFICLALIFGMMTWVSQSTMRRARQDGDNDEFFANLLPATKRDFYPAFATIAVLTVMGIIQLAAGDRGWFALFAVITAAAFLIRQLIVAARFWEMSVAS
jgi:hypothetical protein